MDPDPLGDAIQMAADYQQIKKDVEKKIAAGYCEQQAWSLSGGMGTSMTGRWMPQKSSSSKRANGKPS